VRLTNRGWLALYLVLTIVLVLVILWADAVLFDGNLQAF
jgi:hypothetical protein